MISLYGSVMVTRSSEQEIVVTQINSICLQLFDTWCETRNVTLLAYLMHCWPLIDKAPTRSALRKLDEMVSDLRRYHADQLEPLWDQALSEIAALLDCLI